MIHKLLNHWTERPIRVLAESLRIPWFNLKLNKGAITAIIIMSRHLGFPWSQAPLGRNLGRSRGRGLGRGEVTRWRVAKKSEQYYRGVTASFTVDLPDLKIFIYFFLIPCMEKHSDWHVTTQSSQTYSILKTRTNVRKKNDRILIKDLISYKLKYWTKEARLILHSGIYIFCYQYFGRHGLPSSGLGSYIQWYGLS